MLTSVPSSARRKSNKSGGEGRDKGESRVKAGISENQSSTWPDTKSVARKVLAFYKAQRRDLPWRAAPGALQNPYKVWLSEIMLQQTTVAAVTGYYEKFLGLWPNFAALAAAPIDEVMKAWAGLGYYSRARNLHACAQTVMRDHDGCLPDVEAALRKLPGIGAYTSAAIASIAFGKRAVVVDANVERVVARLFALDDDLKHVKKQIRICADSITPAKQAGDFAQGMMDLGATVCAPKKPACLICPLRKLCRARSLGNPEAFPRRAEKKAKPLRRGVVFFVRRADGKVLMRTRPSKGLLGGMSEFPGSDWTEDFDDSNTTRSAPLSAKWKQLPGHVEHVFTHFKLKLQVYFAVVSRGRRAPAGSRFVAENQVSGEALPTLMRKVLDHAEQWQSKEPG